MAHIEGHPPALCNSGDMEGQGLHHAMGVYVDIALCDRGIGQDFRKWYQFLVGIVRDCFSNHCFCLSLDLPKAN